MPGPTTPFTTLPVDVLIAHGSRLRASHLIKQSGVTLDLANDELAALDEHLPDGLLEAVAAVVEEVDEARKDKTLLAQEAKDAKGAEDDVIRSVKVWRRKVIKRAARARHAGHSVPDSLTKATSATSGTELDDQMAAILPELERNIPVLDTVGKNSVKLHTEGTALLGKLRSAGTEQEAKRLAALPAAVRAFYHQKGLLYIGLKLINDAGQELHAGDLRKAAQYNLAILYRRTPEKDKKTEG